MADPIIDVHGLDKRFGNVAALDDFRMSVEPGGVMGFLGPNGAGKSTAIRVLLGIIKADSGTATIFGLDAWERAETIHRRTAYVPGDTSLWPQLSGGEIIDLFAAIRGHRTDASARQRLLDRFELDPTKKARTYSKGNRQKVALVAALSAPADLYIFDEPTSGLDPLMENVFQEEVRALRNAEKTVLLSSHVLSEVEALCDSVTIIRDGASVESGSMSELRHLTQSHVAGALEPASVPAVMAELEAQPALSDLSFTDGRLTCLVGGAAVNEVVGVLLRAGVQGLVVEPPSLEQIFMSHYRSSENSAGHSGHPRH